MNSAQELFENGIRWLQENYTAYRFYVERDIVWTIQGYLRNQIETNQLNYKIYNDYGILPGNRRRLSADLVILSSESTIDVAVEFKYEPSHKRVDIPHEKFDVVSWGEDGVAHDITRCEEFIRTGRVQTAYSIFIDEGRRFRNRPAHPNSWWEDWDNGVSVLFSKVGKLPG